MVDGKTGCVNPAGLEIRGYPPEEIEGHSPLVFIAPEDRDWVAERLKAFVES